MELTDLDKRLIEKEEKKYGDFILKNVNITRFDIDEIFKEYDCIEMTEHYYDSMPSECIESCPLNLKNECWKCEKYKKYEKSIERLTHESWIDVWGPGICDMDQNKVNKFIKEHMNDRLKEDADRFFYAWSDTIQPYLRFFYYYRDSVDKYDIWYIFKRK